MGKKQPPHIVIFYLQYKIVNRFPLRKLFLKIMLPYQSSYATAWNFCSRSNSVRGAQVFFLRPPPPLDHRFFFQFPPELSKIGHTLKTQFPLSQFPPRKTQFLPFHFQFPGDLFFFTTAVQQIFPETMSLEICIKFNFLQHTICNYKSAE